MIKLLEKKFIKDSDINNPKVREKYGILGGILGIICNFFLFIIKITIGLLMKSIAIMSDAFNNMSDTFSSIVGIVSAKLSNKKPDKDHPFGHGRIEYIATLIVSMIIVIVGVELLTNSANKIINGIKGNFDVLNFSWISIIILSCSLLVKLWMHSYNKYLGKKINSSILLATAADSISDVLTSSAVIITTIVGYLWLKDSYFYLDGIMGIIIAIIICINGLKLIFSTINDLLGKPATEEELQEIENFLLSDKHILGVHDLMVHDYGPGRKIVTAHCEVDDRENVVEAHEIIDNLENKALSTLNILMSIHMDPINTTNEIVINLKKIIQECINKIDNELSFHDLRITDGINNINVIFDLVVPFSYNQEKINQTINQIKTLLKEKDNKYNLVCKVDYK